jgi:hypothetical protein
LLSLLSNFLFFAQTPKRYSRKENEMSRLNKNIFLVLAMVFALGLAACQKEGAFEKAGEKIDSSAAKIGQKIEGAGEAIRDKAN